MQNHPVQAQSPSNKKWLFISIASLLLSLFIEVDRRDVLGLAYVVAAVALPLLLSAGFVSHPRTQKLIRFAGIALFIASLGLFLLWLLRRT